MISKLTGIPINVFNHIILCVKRKKGFVLFCYSRNEAETENVFNIALDVVQYARWIKMYIKEQHCVVRGLCRGRKAWFSLQASRNKSDNDDLLSR